MALSCVFVAAVWEVATMRIVHVFYKKIGIAINIRRRTDNRCGNRVLEWRPRFDKRSVGHPQVWVMISARRLTVAGCEKPRIVPSGMAEAYILMMKNESLKSMYTQTYFFYEFAVVGTSFALF